MTSFIAVFSDERPCRQGLHQIYRLYFYASERDRKDRTERAINYFHTSGWSVLQLPAGWGKVLADAGMSVLVKVLLIYHLASYGIDNLIHNCIDTVTDLEIAIAVKNDRWFR